MSRQKPKQPPKKPTRYPPPKSNGVLRRPKNKYKTRDLRSYDYELKDR